MGKKRKMAGWEGLAKGLLWSRLFGYFLCGVGFGIESVLVIFGSFRQKSKI
jgi:hypothetical protein